MGLRLWGCNRFPKDEEEDEEEEMQEEQQEENMEEAEEGERRSGRRRGGGDGSWFLRDITVTQDARLGYSPLPPPLF